MKLAFATWFHDFAIALHLERQPIRLLIPLRAALASLLCLLVLICGILAVNPAGHDTLHAHEHGHGHHQEHGEDAETSHEESTCAVCLFAGGAVALALPQPAAVNAWSGVLLATLITPIPSLSPGCLLTADGRGPPVRG